MKRGVRLLLFMILLLPIRGWNQEEPASACRVEEGRLIFTLDKRWNAGQRAEISRLFSLDSALLAKAFRGEASPVAGNVTWSVKKIDANRLELSKPLNAAYSVNSEQQDVSMLDDSWIGVSGALERESDSYGINLFTRFDVFNYRNGIARFFLPGNQKARQVYLSGSFNNWSTVRAPMQHTDSGWVAMVRLKPGKYTYKYIVDGRWIPDPFNRQMAEDAEGNHNSVVFCYNHNFYLRGYKEAREVTVTGSFSGWDSEGLHMQRVSGGWIRGLYLREGTYAYKFIVDRTYILDPGNKIVRPDGNGHQNSFVSIGDTFYFRLAGYQNISKVAVAGNFNGWNTGELFLEKKNGGWQLPYVLGPGNYEYKFLVDGRWITDPANPYSTGYGELKNSFMAIKPNHIFFFGSHSDAKRVIVTGSFNGWKTEEYRMVWNREKYGWIFPINLKPGKHTYKFIFDFKWILDPANDLWEDNEYGTGNSVLWIEP